MDYNEKKKYYIIIPGILIFLFFILYIAINVYGRISSFQTGNVDIFNIKTNNKNNLFNNQKISNADINKNNSNTPQLKIGNVIDNNINNSIMGEPSNGNIINKPNNGNINNRPSNSNNGNVNKRPNNSNNGNVNKKPNNSNSNNGSNNGNNNPNNGNNPNGGNIDNNPNNPNNNNTDNGSDNGNENNIQNNIIEEKTENRDGMIKAFDDVDWTLKSELKIFANPLYQFKSIISPGSSNVYKYIVRNSENFKVHYTMKFMENNNDSINMKFKLKKNGEYVIGNSYSWVDIHDKSIENVDLQANSQDEYLLEWKWVDGINDANAGFNQSKYKLNIGIKAES